MVIDSKLGTNILIFSRLNRAGSLLHVSGLANLGSEAINRLVPKKGNHVPHPSNGQKGKNMTRFLYVLRMVRDGAGCKNLGEAKLPQSALTKPPLLNDFAKSWTSPAPQKTMQIPSGIPTWTQMKLHPQATPAPTHSPRTHTTKYHERVV